MSEQQQQFLNLLKFCEGADHYESLPRVAQMFNLSPAEVIEKANAMGITCKLVLNGIPYLHRTAFEAMAASLGRSTNLPPEGMN